MERTYSTRSSSETSTSGAVISRNESEGFATTATATALSSVGFGDQRPAGAAGVRGVRVGRRGRRRVRCFSEDFRRLSWLRTVYMGCAVLCGEEGVRCSRCGSQCCARFNGRVR